MTCTRAVGLIAAVMGLATCGGKSLKGLDASPDTAERGDGGADVADTAPPEPTCGGNLLGPWEGTYENHIAQSGPAATDPCHLLQLAPQDDGTFSARLTYPLPDGRAVRIVFQDTSFETTITVRGQVKQSYAAACLSTAGGSPTCAQLGEVLLSNGIGEGSVRKVDCTPAAAGGCDCTFEVMETGGGGGRWSVAGNELSLIVSPGTAFEKTLKIPYCVDAGTLRFGAAIDGYAPGLSHAVFSVPDCHDGKRGVFEDGIDCGGFCEAQCP